ncbi:MAG: phosphoribosylformylglycinamidine synthase subunit PurS [Tagaea sp.]|nr:phosphoribosylformylglycinamidine synthase subunit PurS [Tagaea sp.]
MKAKIHVTLKNGVLDVQGKAVQAGLAGLGFQGVGEVRVGRYVEIELAATSKAAAEAEAKKMCDKLLANTVIENYRVEIAE